MEPPPPIICWLLLHLRDAASAEGLGSYDWASSALHQNRRRLRRVTQRSNRTDRLFVAAESLRRLSRVLPPLADTVLFIALNIFALQLAWSARPFGGAAR